MEEKRNLYPIKFIPVAEKKPWGGSALIKGLGKEFTECDKDGNEVKLTEKDHIGESWELADMGFIDSVVSNGWLAGNTFGEIMETYIERIAGEDVFAFRKPRAAQTGARLAQAVPAFHALFFQSFVKLRRYAQRGVEKFRPALGNEANLFPAQGVEFALRQRRQLLAVQRYLSRCRAVARKKPRDGEGGHCLSAARLADYREFFALVRGKRKPRDDFAMSVGEISGYRQIFRLKQHRRKKRLIRRDKPS